MSIQAVSFGATTKKGNPYKKTHVGTITGAAVGATIAAIDLNIARKIKLNNTALRPIVTQMKKLIDTGMSRQSAKKVVINCTKAGMAGAAIGFGLAYFGLGAGVNKIINHFRAKRADEAAIKKA